MVVFGTTLALTGVCRNRLSLPIHARSSGSGYTLPLAAAMPLMATTGVTPVLARLPTLRRK